MLRPLLTTLALLLTTTSPLAAQDATATKWTRLLARDELVSFTSRTELAARTALEGDGLDQDGRAAAIFALGASRSNRGRALLNESLASGPLVERCAAVLALGEIGVGVGDLLESLRNDPEPLVSECALLALMRTGRWAAAEYVEAVAENGDDAHAQMAGQLLLFATNAPASEETEASGLLLRLRWDAARQFGLVDDQAWEVVLLEELATREEFLKDLMLNAAAELDRPGVKDHFLSMAEEEMKKENSKGLVSAPTLRAALRAMPMEVSLLVETGLWPSQWDILLTEIRRSRLENSTRGLLVAAYEDPAMRYRAVNLLVRSGSQAPLLPVIGEIRSGKVGPMQLIWCCEALGESGNQAAKPTLELLSRDERLVVAWAARIQLARLGNPQAVEMVRGALGDPESPGHKQVVHMVSELAHDPSLVGLLIEALPILKGMRALEVSSALTEVGSTAGRERLREAVRMGLPPTKLGARAVDALSRSASVEDVAYIRHQFPYGEYSENRLSEGDLDVNAALAMALIQLQDPVVLPLIRAGIWDSAGFDECVLASALLIEVAGMSALLDEVKNERAKLDKSTGIYSKASPRAARRVGYALGLWGGGQVLKDLASDFPVNEPGLQGAVLGALASRTH